VVGAVFGLVVGVVGGAALGLHAADPEAGSNEQIKHAASDAGVDAMDLAGAVNSTGLDPYVYLRSVGELEHAVTARPPVVAVSPPVVPPAVSVFDRLVQCEANGNWHANTGNGFFGGAQILLTTWRAYGGTMYASRPDLASRAEQIVVSTRILAGQGWGAWPTCSRALGLR
jgi:hypothetical protein